ncbi:hypothetical protein LQG66_04940 [Bradyrhizobium ontarionense]|uniref:Uncharacterized protein n=1 Tax=Bradyrhizobium ontarionense TaxID=2898149 RepID=A0ABY3RFQ5_9BRAD|nr:hypothetical protein [Bradyrhizobium sp. A19]UFZ05663.1 hypothetical protein LQG66_04940 [Bradyrhizobium sp. A19]
MQTIPTSLRQMPEGARAFSERGTTAALVAFYSALALIAAITLGTMSIHPF